jgi:protein TonB
MSRQEKDKKNKRTGIIISAAAHFAVILLFIFLVAWRAPNPPLPEFGIELNFGTSD